MIDTRTLTIEKAGEALRSGEFSSLDLVSACLQKIKERNDELHAFLEVFSGEKYGVDDVYAQAKRADEMIKNGKGVAMTGIPIAI